MKFPLYRKYSNNLAYFKVISEMEWEELQFIGNKCTIHKFYVKILLDRNYVHDLIVNADNNWSEIEEGEYEKRKKECS